MKRINFENLNERNDYNIWNFLERGVNVEFIKKGQNYLIKNSNGKIVSEKEKLQLENNELVLEDISSNNCQQETTKKIKKNKKRIKEIEEKENDTLEETTETKE